MAQEREYISKKLSEEYAEHKRNMKFAIKELQYKLLYFQEELDKFTDPTAVEFQDCNNQVNMLSDQFDIISRLYHDAIKKAFLADGYFDCLEAYKSFSE